MPPPATVFLSAALLPKRNLPNTRRMPNGTLVPLSADEFMQLERADTRKRSQVPGALFSGPFDDSSQWPHHIRTPTTWGLQHGGAQPAPRAYRIDAQSCIDPCETSVVLVRYPRRKDFDWSATRAAAMGLFAMHNAVREHDQMQGGMVGAGHHLTRLGTVAPFASAPTKVRKRKVGTTDDAASWMAIAGKALFALFRGFDVGFEQLLQMGRSSSIPTLGDDLPACFAVSQNLGNPEHLDPDAARGYAQWVVDNSAAQIRSWYFLLPQHGIAIELCDGCAISWDGRAVYHCSGVPDADTDLYSVWTSVSARVANAAGRTDDALAALKTRSAPRDGGHSRAVNFYAVFQRFGKVAVRYKWTAADGNTFWATGNLEDVNGKTGAVTIKDGPGTFVEPMSNAQAQQRIVFLDESQRVILA